MKILELFAGTRSIGKAFEARGHEVYSVEYKMWGNGIALPTALYCMQGMADALGEK